MVQLTATITCPLCGHSATATVPRDACLFFYECAACRSVIKPKPGDCCVFCSYGDRPCATIEHTGSDSTHISRTNDIGRGRDEIGEQIVQIEIKILTNEDGAVLDEVVPGVFDDALDPRATREFLRDPRHHLAVAREAGVVVAFASAVHYVHPDKPLPELWINEIGVAPTHRGRGIGKALLHSLTQRASALGCREAWVLTDRGNEAAMRLYRSSGGVEAVMDQVLFTFSVKRSDA